MGKLEEFYEWIRWKGWEEEVRGVRGDQAYSFAPPLFTCDGKGRENRRVIAVEEVWEMTMEYQRQLGAG